MDSPNMALEKAIDKLQLHSPTGRHAIRITDLSDDIILSIVEFLCHHCIARKEDVPEADVDSAYLTAIMKFSQTCFRFHRLARPYIFHHLYLSYDYLAIRDDSWEDDTKREKSMLRLLATLAGDHARHAADTSKRSLSDGIDDFARSVKYLEVNLSPIAHNDSGETGSSGLATPTTWWYDWLPTLLNRLVNLEHLEATMERPRTKRHLFISSLDRNGLSRYESIKTLTLTYRGDCNEFIGNADLRDTHMLFYRCPNLEVLEIRGIGGIGCRVMENIMHVRGNLKTIRLINCALQVHDVAGLLVGVMGLETFVLGRGKFRRFQWMGEFRDLVPSRQPSRHHPSCTPSTLVYLLRRYGNQTLKHLELRPFELKMWQSFWSPNPSGGADEARQKTRAAVIDSLRDFTKLETLQLGQDSILGIPNMWLNTMDGPMLGPVGMLGPDGRFEIVPAVSHVKRHTTILPDHGGTRLLDLLPRTLKSLRITNVNQYLASNLLNFANAVSAGEFPALVNVSLHGENEAADRLRHGDHFRIEFLRGMELDWPFLEKSVLESMQSTLYLAGVQFSWDAMDSNEPVGGWPGDPAQEFGWAPTPRRSDEELAFFRFSRERYEKFCDLVRAGNAYGAPPGNEWASEPDTDEEYIDEEYTDHEDADEEYTDHEGTDDEGPDDEDDGDEDNEDACSDNEDCEEYE
ncbi:hypothetical protein CkaCkLH20_12273 [Colletotrichum karsti]|uniref:F-box domain-containing protein n=1 Tax=Colletotrichum karsti TaxID=1095194 RepID=A0A9P6HUQ3_9PEZI|nr:uncharacterized protein CkaCkLH20_12273 [Colletotrichum karsti]KAF9870187.1 hypothetical protein CkaCkLH20_12273 [Colletotrichum karsti]